MPKLPTVVDHPDADQTETVQAGDETIRLVLVEPRVLYGAGVRDILEREPDIEVVAQARTTGEVPDLLTSQPDVVLVDIEPSEPSTVAATLQLRRDMPEAAVIIVGSPTDDDDLFRSVQAGAAAHVGTDAEPSELVDTIRRVADGDEPIVETIAARPEVAHRVVEAFQELAVHGLPPDPADVSPLTAREQEVLAHIARGLTNKEIAGDLGISQQTVKNHLSNAIRKLGARGRTQAVLFATRLGVLSLEDDPRSEVPSHRRVR